MSSAIIVEKLDGNSGNFTSTRNQLHQFQFIDPTELELAAQQVKRDLRLMRTEMREPLYTHKSTLPHADQLDKDVKFVRHYATPRRTVSTREEQRTTQLLPRLLNFESKTNQVLEKLQDILLEKPPPLRIPKNLKFTQRKSSAKTPVKAQRSLPRGESDWLGPATYIRKTPRVESPTFQMQDDKFSHSASSKHSSPRITDCTSKSAAPRGSHENLLFKTIQNTLKKIDDEELSIARRLADLSFTSSSQTSRSSPAADRISVYPEILHSRFETRREPLVPDTTAYRRPFKTTRDEKCQTVEELGADNQSIRSESDLPSAAESILEQLEQEGFYESLLQYELDLIT